ncbi:MAG: hypothetical protein A2W29_02095 [Gemmatimonadetes bacterium RBG_16_66_8]|nr:MAG: hypothetical protein A2W29_02095 [Gemmatimonadetes bacterium RBG_16_66_8]
MGTSGSYPIYRLAGAGAGIGSGSSEFQMSITTFHEPSSAFGSPRACGGPDLAPFARFPQGMPVGLQIGSLRPKRQ